MTQRTPSLRLRLFLLIAAATTLIWSAAAAWTVLSARSDIERVLDRRLREAATMVASLGYENAAVEATMRVDLPSPAVLPTYERQLSCQIWSVSGDLLGLSGGAPRQPLSVRGEGFSERMIDGVGWRVFTHVSPGTGLRIMVGDTLAMRRQLIADLLEGLIVPALIGLGALGVLLWIGVGRGLSPVRRITAAIASRRPEDLRMLDVAPVPRELAPLTAEIDSLFVRIENLRSGERRFLASAAHEMLTPLAGLRTHAEIALRSDDRAVRDRALKRIRVSVDRTARLVRQLLDLSRQEAQRKSGPGAALLGTAFDLVAQELEPVLAKRDVRLTITHQARGACLPLDPDSLFIALRNLVENAAIHGPREAVVAIGACEDGFYVEDRGSGIAPLDIETLLQPFARCAAHGTPGTGLGLAIAKSALAPDMALAFREVNSGFRALVLSKK